MTEARLPRYNRAQNPPSMVLTERDREVIKTVHAYGMLSRSQIETLLFTPEKGQGHPTKTSRCRRRLQLLYHNEYLERIPVRVQFGPGCSDFVYCLARRGAELVSKEVDGEINWRPGSKVLTAFFLEHTLKTNDFRIAVVMAAEAEGFTAVNWVDENALKAMQVQVRNPESVVESLPFRPDGFFSLMMKEGAACFFVEIDRGTMPSTRFADKVKAYRGCRQSGTSHQRFGTRNFRVLTVTTGKRRLKNLVKATEEARGDHRFWFATFDAIKPETVLSARIWQATGQDGLRSLRD